MFVPYDNSDNDNYSIEGYILSTPSFKMNYNSSTSSSLVTDYYYLQQQQQLTMDKDQHRHYQPIVAKNTTNQTQQQQQQQLNHNHRISKNIQKRKRRKFQEVERVYFCNYPNCNKGYSSLSHLNDHITIQNHGARRNPEEFKELRRLLKLKSKNSSQLDNQLSLQLQQQQLQRTNSSSISINSSSISSTSSNTSYLQYATPITMTTTPMKLELLQDVDLFTGNVITEGSIADNKNSSNVVVVPKFEDLEIPFNDVAKLPDFFQSL